MKPKYTDDFKEGIRLYKAGLAQIEKKNFTDGLKNLEIALRIFIDLKVLEELFRVLVNLVNYYVKLKNFTKAKQVLEEAKLFVKEDEFRYENALYYGLYSKVYLAEKLISESLDASLKQAEILSNLKDTNVYYGCQESPELDALYGELQIQLMNIRLEEQNVLRGTLSKKQKKADELLKSSTELALKGNYAQAVVSGKKAFGIYVKENDNQKIVDSSVSLVSNLNLLQRSKEALRYAQKGLEKAKETQDKYSLFEANMSLGNALKGIDQFSKAIEHLKIAIEIGENLRGLEENALANAYFNLGHAFMKNKEEKNAIKYLTKARKTANLMIDRYLVAKSTLFIGQSYLTIIDNENAAKELNRSVILFQGLVNLNSIFYPDFLEALYTAGITSYANSDPRTAIMLFERGVFIMENIYPSELLSKFQIILKELK